MQDKHAYNRELIEAFRANRGKAGGHFAARPLLLLTTIGAKSGLARTNPLMYIPDGDQLLVLASNFGAPKHPDWYHNLLVHPNVTVEVGSQTYRATSSPSLRVVMRSEVRVKRGTSGGVNCAPSCETACNGSPVVAKAIE